MAGRWQRRPCPAGRRAAASASSEAAASGAPKFHAYWPSEGVARRGGTETRRTYSVRDPTRLVGTVGGTVEGEAFKECRRRC